MKAPETIRWKVSKKNGRWTITSPTGATLEPFPSQGAAFATATSMAGISRLLARVQNAQPGQFSDHPALKPSPNLPNRRTPLQLIGKV